MGYKQKNKVYNLKFEDPDLEGLEVKMTSMTTGELMELTSLRDSKDIGSDAEKMLRIFASHLRSWNLEEEDDTPVPATYEGILTQDFDFVSVIIDAWMEYVGDVKPDLKEQSNSGGTSLAESIPMEISVPDLVS